MCVLRWQAGYSSRNRYGKRLERIYILNRKAMVSRKQTLTNPSARSIKRHSYMIYYRMLSANGIFWWGKLESFCISQCVLTATDVWIQSIKWNAYGEADGTSTEWQEKTPKFWVARATAVQWEQLHTKLQNGLTVPYFQLHSDSTRCRATRLFDSFPLFHILKNMSHYSPHWVMAWETWTVLFQEKAKTSPLGMQEVSSARSLRCRTELAAILFTTKHWTKGYTFA